MAQNLFGLSRNRIYQILEFTDPEDRTSRFVSFGIVGLIIVNVLAIVLESLPSLYEAYEKTFFRLEIVSCTIFILEYVLRVWASVEDPNTIEDESGKQITNGKRRINFMLKPLAIIDFLAFVPVFLQLLFPGVDLRFLRALRLLRVFKLTRYFQSFEMILEVLHDEWRSLAGTMFIMLVILVISACGLYYIERDIQPDKFGSIPQSMWWSIVTLTTVGYGDVYPVTSMGKFFGSIIIILGIGTVALPSGILASAFTEHTKRNQKKYEDQLKLMLSDNIIDDKERKELVELSQRLNLSDEDILAIEEHYKSKK